MGHRANLVIVRDGDWQLYSDRWCACVLDVELFWGPELAERFIRQSPLRDKDYWYDEFLCEGGVILDLDAAVLTWFGGQLVDYEVDLRRVFIEMMQRLWDGWRIRWATGGIVEIGAYLGLPPERFLSEEHSPECFCVLDEYVEDNNILLTVRRDGRTFLGQICGCPEALEGGSAQLPSLIEMATEESLDWVGSMPSGGLHLDPAASSLHYWFAKPTCAVEARVSAAWPGWQTISLADDLEAHLELANAQCRLPTRSDAELRREILERLREDCHEPAANLRQARWPGELLTRIAEALGVRLKLNHEPEEESDAVEEKAEKRRLLADLEREYSGMT